MTSGLIEANQRPKLALQGAIDTFMPTNRGRGTRQRMLWSRAVEVLPILTGKPKDEIDPLFQSFRISRLTHQLFADNRTLVAQRGVPSDPIIVALDEFENSLPRL